jgi:hypothetical protein
MGLILLIIFCVLVFGYGGNHYYGQYGLGGGVGLVLIIVLFLYLLGYIGH